MTQIDLVTHSSVTIDAPADEVWPLILDPNDWKQGLLPTRISGVPNAVGEVRKATAGDAWLCVETVVLDGFRKVVKLTTGGPLDPAWAMWQLRETDGRTVVDYDVYGQLDIGDLDLQTYVEAQEERFAAELRLLKELIESAAPLILSRPSAASAPNSAAARAHG